MSGHSKWANIKHRKQATDIQRGKVFSKLTKEIIIAARIGGADENNNPRLKTAILKAKQANLPKDNIDRAIKKGSGEIDSENYEEILYEGYGPGGVAIIVEAMTDKKSRTLPEIKNIFMKSGGNLAETGAVIYQFDHKGIILIKGATSLDALFEYLIDLKIEDIKKDESENNDIFIIQTSKEDFHEVLTDINQILNEKDLEIIESGLKYIPQVLMTLENERELRELKNLVQSLEEHDDIQNIYYNLSY